MTSKRQSAIFLGLGPRRAILFSIAPGGVGSYATRRVGLRGPEQQDRLAEHLSTKVGQTLDACEGENDLEHEGKAILRTDIEGNMAHLPRSYEDSGERHKLPGWRTIWWSNQATVTQ